MLSLKRMRQQSRPIHCKHLSLIESTTASVTLRKFLPQVQPDNAFYKKDPERSKPSLEAGASLLGGGVSHPPKSFKNREISGKQRENSGKLRENSVTSGNICGC